LSNWVNGFKKVSLTVPVGPLRCLPMMFLFVGALAPGDVARFEKRPKTLVHLTFTWPGRWSESIEVHLSFELEGSLATSIHPPAGSTPRKSGSSQKALP